MNAALGASDTQAAPAVDSPAGPTYCSVAEAAALLGVSRVTIWRWVRAGRLPIWRLGHRTARIKRADLERLLTERARPAGAPGSAEAASPFAAATDAVVTVSHDHVVQFYTADAVLMDAVAQYIGAGLRDGEAGL